MPRIIANGEIIAYTQGESFTSEALARITPNMKRFDFSCPSYNGEPITVKAVSIEAAMQALGIGSDYEAEWGDFRGLIEAHENNDLDCFEVRTIFTKIDLPTSEEIAALSKCEHGIAKDQTCNNCNVATALRIDAERLQSIERRSHDQK